MIELLSLPIIAKWHRDQAKLHHSLARDARAESNVKHCTDMAYLHERWASVIEHAMTKEAK